ncbi:MAG: hypothetical protein ABW167_02325 [Baekduia sp.]
MAVLASALVWCAAVTMASTAHAEFGVTSWDGIAVQQDGTAVTQAGSHPYSATTTLELNVSGPDGGKTVDGSVKNVIVNLPPGLIGNPGAVPTCTNAEMESNAANFGGCPSSTQVGTANVRAVALGSVFSAGAVPVPLFNMKPPPGVAAQFAFAVVGQIIRLNARVRAGGDYGVDVMLKDSGQGIALGGTTATFWGVPSDRAHDGERFCGLYGPPNPCASDAPHRAFLSLPTSCTGPQPTTVTVDSWQQPGVFHSASFLSHDEHGQPVGVSGCDRVPFDPTMSVKPTTSSAGEPTGLAVDLVTPQNTNPDGLAQAHLRKAVVTLPPGMTINAASADGLGACSTEQVALSSPDPAQCPDSSKVGTVRIDTPLVDHPVEGGVYLARQGANPFNSLLAVYLAVDDRQTGTVIKLPGLIEADAVTGRLQATFDNNPQLPFERLHVEFKTGPRAPLTNPSTCGTYTTHAELTSWASSTPVSSDSTTTIDQGCDQAAKFEPTFSAGTTNPTAGASSSFVLDFGRPSGQQTLSTIETKLPTGLLGMVGQVPQCPEVQAAAGTCGAESRIGHVQAASGTGSDPVWLPQAGKAPTAVYLAGPYKGAPYSLSIVVPAQAGPFDLGSVVVRVALFVDPLDAHVTAKADPLPTILQGIPLDVQEVRVTLDRPGFMLNPSSCAEKQITAAITSSQGAAVSRATRFHVDGCNALRLAPKLDLALTGKGQTTDGKHPAVTANLTQPAGGQANIKKVRVALPLSLALDPDNANGLCEFVDGSKVEPTCPKNSIVGTATAVTPILDEPLSGPVYFVKNVRKDAKTGREIRTLPKLVIPLTGQNGVKLTLTGTSNVENDQLVTTFDNIPDAPVSSFKLDIIGGKGGILTISDADICKATQNADQQIDGQNGKQADATVAIQTPSCPLRVLSKSITASSIKLKVGGLGAGKVTVSGANVKTTSRTLAGSTVATITAPLTKAGKRHKPAKVKVSFKANGAKKAVAITAALSTTKK